MKDESKSIYLPLGDVSLNEKLDIYYIDMRPAIIHYTDNIWGGGIDKNGVPFLRKDDGTPVYYAVNIAQYGFILHADYLTNKSTETLSKLKNCIDKLEELKEEIVDYSVWMHHEYNKKYNIQPPYASAMAQGEIISLYLRYYQITNEKHFLTQAIKAYDYLKIEIKDGGVRRFDENGDLWLEEYPSDPPSYVLNGFIYAIFGLFDLFRVTQNLEVKKDIDDCLKTLVRNLPKYDTGYWSRYDLLKKELVKYYYQKSVHVPQLKVLYHLTKEPIFLKYEKKWSKSTNYLNFLFVRLMYRIQPRLKFIFNRI